MGSQRVRTSDVGSRVRYWRERRGFTRGHFADLMGRSPSWVDKVETGERQLDRISVLEQVAEALHLPVHVLLDDDSFQRGAQCVDPAEIAAIRTALQRYDVSRDGVPHHSGEEHAPVSPARLRKHVDHAWTAFQASDYATLGPVLARLLDEATATAAHADEPRQTAALLSETYQIIASTTRKLGYVDLEWIAAERSLATARAGGDPVVFGGAVFRVVNALRDNHGPAAAVTTTGEAADRFAAGGSASLSVRSVYGHLLLQGAMAAAEANDAATARHFLGEARTTAKALGGDRNDYYTAFGPTNVVIHEVAAMVELHEWTTALQVATGLHTPQLTFLPKERRANHLLEIARAYSLAGKRDHALWSLLEADEIAPKEVRCRPAARDLIADLVRRSRTRPSPDLTRLAQRAGVTA
jgi:transcriptional regulator with XRE-family HTH domain